MNSDEPFCYSITAVIRNRRHLLVNEVCAQIVLASLDWLHRRGGLALCGFILLPSHVHFIGRPTLTPMPRLLDAFRRVHQRTNG
jgi:hypothetical protein